MIHFFYLVGFALFVSIAFAVFHNDPTRDNVTTRDRVLFGVKTFLQFVVVALVLAWILYFIPW